MSFFRFIIFLIFPLYAFANEPLFFKNRLQTAHIGDYIATEQEQNFTLFYISSVSTDRIVLNEIGAPLHKRPKSIKNWSLSNFQGHSLWNAYEIDLKNNDLIEAYSYTHQNWLNIDKNDLFLINLLSLPLQEIKLSNRRKIGPPPISDIDRRKVYSWVISLPYIRLQ